mmetsp:Transcript_53850/g.149489  ORF Transcript_53850/g.149489 Transcript_53850/m.149489 type:complete len:134 (+) Transcript_53850:628-1029(+)
MRVRLFRPSRVLGLVGVLSICGDLVGVAWPSLPLLGYVKPGRPRCAQGLTGDLSTNGDRVGVTSRHSPPGCRGSSNGAQRGSTPHAARGGEFDGSREEGVVGREAGRERPGACRHALSRFAGRLGGGPRGAGV